MTTATPMLLAPAEAVDPSPHRPHLTVILKHLGLSLLMANVVPSALFILCLRAGNVWTALIAALVWCYGALVWRIRTKRRVSGLLVLSMTGLTAKTAFAILSGSTFIYFLQPAVTDGVVAALFLISLTTARPVVARLAADFYPMDDEVACRPRIQRLFWRLTLFWAVMCLVKSVFTVFLLESVSTATFVEDKSLFVLAVVVGGAAVTVRESVRVARLEGLLHTHPAPC